MPFKKTFTRILILDTCCFFLHVVSSGCCVVGSFGKRGGKNRCFFRDSLLCLSFTGRTEKRLDFLSAISIVIETAKKQLP